MLANLWKEVEDGGRECGDISINNVNYGFIQAIIVLKNLSANLQCFFCCDMMFFWEFEYYRILFYLLSTYWHYWNTIKMLP